MENRQHYYAYRTFIDNKPSFALLPISDAAVYADGMYYTEHRFLLLLSKAIKERLDKAPKLDVWGEVMIKQGRELKERVRLDFNYEYYLSNPQDIEFFARSFVVNHDELLGFIQELNETQEQETAEELSEVADQALQG